MPHTKTPKKPTMTSAAIAKAEFRKIIFGCIYLINPHKALPARHKAPSLSSGMTVIQFDIFLQRFLDFIYLVVKGLLTPEESENVYKNNRPGYAEGRKKINTVVHYKFLSSMISLISAIRIFNRSNLILLKSSEKNKKQKAIKVIIKESFIGQDMLRPWLVIMTGWIVRHSLMEKNVIGTLIKPMIPKTADRFARWFSFTAHRSIR
jgi:hypothetical protein